MHQSKPAAAPLDLSYWHILAIAGPVLIANLALPLQGAIDVAVVGHFPQTHSLAGLGIASQLWLLLLVSFNFLQYASSGLSAQALGKMAASQQTDAMRHAHHELAAILYRSLGLALLIGGLLWLLKPLLISYGLDLLGALPSSRQAADTYLTMRYHGIVFELMNYAFIGWFAGQGQTKQIMAVQLIISVMNILLTLFFVYQMPLGLSGVALGTVLGYAVGVILAIYLANRHIHKMGKTLYDAPIKKKATGRIGSGSAHAQTAKHYSDKPYLAFKQRLLSIYAADKMLRLFSLNKDIFIRTILLSLSFAWITRLSAQQGDLVMATNALLLQVLSISAFALDGLAVAAESLSGQAIARHKASAFALVVKRTGIVAFGLAIGLTLGWLIVLPTFMHLMTDLAPVYALAVEYRVVAALLPLVGAGAYWLDGIMFGLTAGATIRKVAMIVAAVFFPLTWGMYRQFGDTDAMPIIWLSIYWLLLSRCVVAAWVLWRGRKRLIGAGNMG